MSLSPVWSDRGPYILNINLIQTPLNYKVINRHMIEPVLIDN